MCSTSTLRLVQQLMASKAQPMQPLDSSSGKLFFLTHVDERAPAACRREERRKSVQALRSIELQTRSADLDVFVWIATDKTPLLSPPVELNHWNQLRFSEEYPRGHAALGPRLYATDCCD